MKKSIKLIFYIEAKPKPRARIFADKRGKFRAASKASGKRFEDKLRLLARLQYKNKPIEGPLQLNSIFYLKKPKSAPKNRIWPSVRPDLDNYQKALLDALQGIVFKDDSQICGGSSWKKYTDKERPYIETIFIEL